MHNRNVFLSSLFSMPLMALLAARAGAVPAQDLETLQFKATGLVRSDMRWATKTQECYYVETPTSWSCRWGNGRGGGSYPYLWQVASAASSAKPIAPPLGLRSAVPLGGLGAGTVELRSDGSLCDWNIFNNSPGGGGGKVQLDEAFFGLWVKPAGAPARAWALRTEPPAALPPIAQIEYGGAYPVSRLRLSDPNLPLDVKLYGYSEWYLNDAKRSATPAIIFTFQISNPTPSAVETAVIFNLPNHQKGTASRAARGLRWERDGTAAMSGSICLTFGKGQTVSMTTAAELADIWSQFAQTGQLNNELPRGASENGAVAAKLRIPAGASRKVNLVLSWYFPNRTYANGRIGNFYTTLYPNAAAVADAVLTRLPQTWKALAQWQRLCFDNDLPDWLQDSLLNSAGNMAETGFWAADGRWRQWESFSCANLEPVHIHFYRALPYAFFFPELQKSEFRGFANHQQSDGFIHEDLGNTGRKFDDADGREMGDCTTAFILGVYELYLWTADRAFLDDLWPHVRKAANWQIQRSARFGLPERLCNTYDWWGFEKKDVVAYNSVMHLASLRAAEQLARTMAEPDFAGVCRRHFDSGARRMDELLWNGHYYRAWWMQQGGYPEALHADTLYGQVWASVLGLGWLVDPAKAKAHLAAEREYCESPYGLKVMSGRGNDMIDDLVWQAGSLDWTTLNLYLGEPVQPSLTEAEKPVQNWRERLKDFWDWRDLTRSDNGQPWCNSHYGRQVIFWAIPLALSGQQYSAAEQSLSFAPRPDAPARLPWFVPGAGGVLERGENGRFTLRVLTGKLDLKEWSVGDLRSRKPRKLTVGDSARLGG